MTILPIIVSWFLTLGYVPEMSDQQIASYIEARNTTTAQLGLSFETQDSRFKVYTDIQSFQDPTSLVSFSPFRIDYSVGAQFSINPSLHLNIDHECVHPISDGLALNYNYASSITTLSLTVKGSTK